MSENPEIELIDANVNPWYVLATVFGEQDGRKTDADLARKNRAVWNAWALSQHSEEARRAFFDGLPESYFQDYVAGIKSVPDWEERISSKFLGVYGSLEADSMLPKPSFELDWSHLNFRHNLVISGFFFPMHVTVLNSRFRHSIAADKAVFNSHMFTDDLGVSSLFYFEAAKFAGFCNLTGLSADVVNMVDAEFRVAPPRFSDGAQFNSVMFSRDFRGWPALNRVVQVPETKGFYITLRRMMADRQDTDMEHFFYRQEMRCIIAENGGNFWKRLPYQLYGVFSDFGHSIARPVMWLAGLWGVMAIVYGVIFRFWGTPEQQGVSTVAEHAELLLFSGGYSAANMFAFLGFRGLYLDDEIDKMSGWVQVLSAGQTMASFALLFFLALALRNRFRLT